MKKIIFLLLIISTIPNIFAQENQTVSVEKSIFGVQTGLLGIWGHNESRLTKQFSLRSEIGMDMGILIGGNSNDNFVLIPVIRLEPRWYYNLEKRSNKSKSISKNSGNFLTVNTTYNPDWFSISNSDNIKVISTIAIIPKWGIKRTYGKGFTFETGIGVGYIKSLNPDYDLLGDVGVDLHLRLGYTF
jgi:hypothetical protein